MKIRKGFVSNSSSSSFAIYGIILNDEMIWDLRERYSDLFDEDGYCEDVSELSYSLAKDVGMNSYSGISNYNCEFIGVNVDSLDENRTIKEQKLEMLEKIKKHLPDIKIEDINFYEDGGYYDY